MSSSARGPFNVILISFDTLRRDHLGCYGYEKEISPNLDKLADEGVMFEDSIANCGWTLPQHVTMITGVHPIEHGVVYLQREQPIPEDIPTIGEIFQDAGYVTLAFCNQNHYGGDWRYGFQRGMNSFTNVFHYNNMMENVVPHVNAYMELLRDKPFLMYIHTNDTHEHFAASEPFGSKWGTSYHSRYEGEISYVDHYFGQILDKLDDLGLSEKTLVVATSDHGSEFKEHGFLEKKLNLYDEIVSTPLLMRLPGELEGNTRCSGLVATRDILPTVLDLCSIDTPLGVSGESLLDLAEGRGSPRREVFSHTLHESMYWYEHWSVRTDEHKLILTYRLPMPEGEKNLVADRFRRLEDVAINEDGHWIELYDLQQDPGEERNMAEESEDLVDELTSRLTSWVSKRGYAPQGDLL